MKIVSYTQKFHPIWTLPCLLWLFWHTLTRIPGSSANIAPPLRIVREYDGGDMILNQRKNLVLSPSRYPELLSHVGEDLIVTDGTTLLGADGGSGYHRNHGSGPLRDGAPGAETR